MSVGGRHPSGESPRWDPAQYAQFRRERARPFHDLLARIPDRPMGAVADLGCGSGELTCELLERWPEARVWGIDESAEMLAGASALPQRAQLSFVRSDLREWRPERPLDLVVSNAVLHWVPDHDGVLAQLVRLLAPRGVLAVQIPNNQGETSHRILAELSSEAPWARRLRDVQRPQSLRGAAWYLDHLLGLGLEAEVWETIYYHELPGARAIVDWMKGTALRPVLTVLSSAQARAFEAALQRRIAIAYPERPRGVIFPFRRLFFVARTPGAA
jgi:trans-aconitate 2-methyltransferase